jgi:hypothetical protein
MSRIFISGSSSPPRDDGSQAAGQLRPRSRPYEATLEPAMRTENYTEPKMSSLASSREPN